MAVVLFVYLLSMACWLGGIVFFSFFAAPIIFTRLPVAEAGKVVGAIFPLYYSLGYVTGAVSLLIVIFFAASRPARGWWGLSAMSLAVALALTFYAGVVVRPQTQALRSVAEETQPDLGRRARFDALHRLSVQLNGAVLVLDLLALLGTAAALSKHG